MKLKPAPFNLIKSGTKTIELRLYDDKRRAIEIGDEIEFTRTDSATEKLLCSVVDIHTFSSFAELYGALPLLKCGYTEENLSQARPEDMNQYYSEEELALFGVVGIEIKLIV